MTDWSLNPRIRHAAHVMRLGGVIAYPTEAVWGLGCNPFDRQAVEFLLSLKQRPMHKGLILIAADIHQLEPFIHHLDDLQRQRLKNSWPGPVTWLVPRNAFAPFWVTGDSPSIALRVTDHPLAAGLCRAFGAPIVSTSANPQGRPPARDTLTLRRYFGGQLDVIAPGKVGRREKPSEIRDLLTGEIRRPG
ncbi:MAG: Sua5/YciO/YrdC/YwlC family protein [Cellvibrio sp.]|jgi:L-threonylcarbamoyladenylate synthase